MFCNKKDPKYIGIPNICFSLSDDSENQKEHKKQRIERGFDDSELWSFDYTIARFTLPRLIEFKKQYSQYVEDVNDLLPKIDMVIKSFEMIINDDVEQEEEIQKGLTVFGKIFRHLWW
jgi:hypothetical protein